MSIARAAFGGATWREAVSLRRLVLRAPLGLDFAAEELAGEAAQAMLVLRDGERVAATLLLVPPAASGGDARVRQMAVLPDRQGRGFGTALMRRAEEEARGLGAAAIVLHARTGARGFYARLGYRAEGAPFVEVTLEHVRMRKALVTREAAGARSTA